MEVKEMRERYKLTQQKLYEITGIPIRTIQNWESGVRQCPKYVLDLLEFYLENKKQ